LQKPARRIADIFAFGQIFFAILMLLAKTLYLGKYFSRNQTFCDRRHIAFLICAGNARVLKKPARIDKSENIPDLGKPEKPFVKFVHSNSRAFSLRASPSLFFSLLFALRPS